MFANAVMYNKSTTEIAKETNTMAKDVEAMVDEFRNAEKMAEFVTKRREAMLRDSGVGQSPARAGTGTPGEEKEKEKEKDRMDEGKEKEEGGDKDGEKDKALGGGETPMEVDGSVVDGEETEVESIASATRRGGKRGRRKSTR
jgi:hypothetical protein